MSIYQRDNSSIWWCSFQSPDGRQIRKSLGTTDKRQAQELHDKLKAELWRTVRLKEKPRYTWQEAVVRYLEENQNQRSLETTKIILRYLHQHLADKKLDEINRATVDYIRTHRKNTGVSDATVNRNLTILRAVLNAAKSWEWIDSVPTVQLLKVQNERVRWLTPEEAQRLLNELPEHLNALMRFSLLTGLRASNVTGLKWSQVDMQRRCAWIHPEQSKSKKAIAVPLNDEALAVIREQIGKSLEYVFTYKGNPIKQASTRAWRNALKRAGIEDFRYHDLRHTFASWHRMAGTPLDVIKELGGWSDYEMVLRYAHISSDHLQEFSENSNRLSTKSSQPVNLKVVKKA